MTYWCLSQVKNVSHDDNSELYLQLFHSNYIPGCNNNNNNNVSLLQLQTNAAKDIQQHLPRRTVQYTQFSTVMQEAIQGR